MLKRIYTAFIHVLALCGIHALVSSRLKTDRSPMQAESIALVKEGRETDSSYPLLKLGRHDPFLKWLKDGLRLSNVSVIVLVVVIVAICNLVIGFIASSYYQGGGQTLRDRGYLLFLLTVDFIITPVTLYLYLWQPSAIAKVLKGLERNDAIDDVRACALCQVQSYAEFRIRIQNAMDKHQWSLVTLAGFAGIYVIEWLFVWPTEFAQLGGESYWFATKWYLPIHLFSFFPALYAVGMFGLRQILAVVYFNRLFQWFEIRLHPMHPDDSGGLGPLGTATAQSTLVAVVLGGIAIWYIVSSAFRFQQAWNQVLVRPDVLIGLGGYIALVLASLILPMWSAHGAMEENRDRELHKVAQEIESVLGESQQNLQDPKLLESAATNLSKLRSQYKAILEIYPTWPIPMQLFRNVSITATLPILSGLVPVVVRIISGG